MVIFNARKFVSLTVAMLFAMSLVHGLAGDLPSQQPVIQQPTAFIRELLKSHCLDCHSDSTKEGSLDISTLQWEAGSDLQKLVRIYERAFK